jgi:DNA processing protein
MGRVIPFRLPPTSLQPNDPIFGGRLLDLPLAFASISVSGPLDGATRVVAIIGTREPTKLGLALARAFAGAVVARGAVVASGGARGIDAMAHQATIAAGGRTWVVAPTGWRNVFPREHGRLYEKVLASGGAMIWPFAPEQQAWQHTFVRRNAVLAALADHVVVVQADSNSGSKYAAGFGARMGRGVWALVGGPHDAMFKGCRELVRDGVAWPAFDLDALATAVMSEARRPNPKRRRPRSPPRRATKRRRAPPSTTVAAGLAPDELLVWGATRSEPTHRDEIMLVSSLPASVVAVALLTLTLKDVLVEEPPGFFRKRV